MDPNRYDDQYIVIADRIEFYEKLKSMGYKQVFIEDFSKEIPDEEIGFFLSLKKVAATFVFINDQEQEGYTAFKQSFLEKGGKLYQFDLSDDLCYETECDDPSIENALLYFPSKNTIVSRLMNRSCILCVEYSDNQCGNCHENIKPEDKYCPYCGTERGKGEFLPYESGSYCVYGPPIKEKYKCQDCGGTWITTAGPMKFCPQCGGPATRLRYQAAEGLPAWYFPGEPFEDGPRPILFSEDQVDKLLEFRTSHPKDEKTWFSYECEDISAMRRAGVNIPDDRLDEKGCYQYPLTKTEGEMLSLAPRILWTTGYKPLNSEKYECPYCNSRYSACIAYELKGKDNKTIARDVHNRCPKNSVIFHSREWLREEEMSTMTAYLCLKCGAEFGRIDSSKRGNLMRIIMELVSHNKR